MSNQHFSLKWGNHLANMFAVFDNLLSIGALVDVTLACESLSLKAHKIVLSAYSSFFHDLFLENPCKHHVVVLKDVSYQDLKLIVYLMYHGEVNVPHHQLPSFLKTAEILKVKGLAEEFGDSLDTASTPQNVRPNTSSAFQPNISDPTPMRAKRKRVRSRKRSSDFSSSSSEKVIPMKMRELPSPDIKEVLQETAESIPSNMTFQPGTSASKESSMKHRSTLNTQIQDFGCKDIEPSKLLVQSLSPEMIPQSAALQSNVPIQSLFGIYDVRSLSVPTVSDCSQSLSPFQEPGSPWGNFDSHIKPEIMFENESLQITQPSVDPSLPGTSQETGGQEDNTMVS